MTSDRTAVLAAAQQILNVDPTASMGMVAGAAGISRATLHRHFDSREALHRHVESRDALLVELGTRSLARWEQRMDGIGLERVASSGDAATLRASLETLVLGYVDDSDDFGFALTDTVILANAELEERTIRLADREAVLFAAAQDCGVLRQDVPRRWFGHAVYGLLVAGREAVRLGDVARRDIGVLVLSSLFAGVATS